MKVEMREGVMYEPPNTRSEINDKVKEELAGNWPFLTDTQGFKRAHEDKDSIHRNFSILYIAATKDLIDFWDDLNLPLYQTRNTKRYKDFEKFIKDGTVEIDGTKDTGLI